MRALCEKQQRESVAKRDKGSRVRRFGRDRNFEPQQVTELSRSPLFSAGFL